MGGGNPIDYAVLYDFFPEGLDKNFLKMINALYRMGYRENDISKIFGITVGSIRRYLKYARRKIFEAVMEKKGIYLK